MSLVHSRNTRPELYLRQVLWAEGFRYRLHVKKLPGTPDLVLAKYRFGSFRSRLFLASARLFQIQASFFKLGVLEPKLDGNVARDVP